MQPNCSHCTAHYGIAECKNRDGLLRENVCARAVDNVRSVAFAAMALIVAYIIARKRLIRLTALEQSAQLFIAVLALTSMLGYMLEHMLHNIHYAIQRERKIGPCNASAVRVVVPQDIFAKPPDTQYTHAIILHTENSRTQQKQNAAHLIRTINQKHFQHIILNECCPI